MLSEVDEPSSGRAATGFSRAKLGTKLTIIRAAGQPLAQLLKRPEVTIEHLAPILRKSHPRSFSKEIPPENPRESVAVNFPPKSATNSNPSKPKSNTQAISCSSSAPSIA